MAVPQGSTPLNVQYFVSATNRINSARSCVELGIIVAEIFVSLQGNKTAMAAEAAAVAPILALLTPPGANPTEIVTWIESFITNYLTPQTKAAVTFAAQLPLLIAEIATLTAAVATAAAKFESCVVTPPPII